MTNKTEKLKKKTDQPAHFVKVLIKQAKHQLKSNYAVNISGEHYFIKENSKQRERILVDKEAKEIHEIENPEVNNKKQKSKKKKLLNVIFFLVNIGVVAAVLAWQISSDGWGSLDSIVDVNWWYIAIAIALVFVTVILDQIRYTFLLYKGTGLFRPTMLYKMAAVGRHYDIITPLGSGGQPFQIFYLNKYGIKAGESVSVIMSKYIFQELTFFILATCVLFTNLDAIGGSGVVSGVANTLSWVGYIAIAFVIFFVALVSLNRRLGAGLVVGILKLLHKMKIIKNYNKIFKMAMKTVNSWQSTMRVYKNSFFTWIFMLLTSAMYFAVFYSIPFFIYCGFAGWHPENWITIVAFGIMIDLSSMCNPLPIGAGTSEITFSAMFATLLGTNIFWPLLIWKIATFYVYIIQGLGIISYDFAYGDKKLEKNKEKWLHPPYLEKVLERRRQRYLRKQQKKENKQK